MAPSAEITVLLVDDHPVVRNGYRILLEDSPDVEVVAEANSGEEAIQVYAERQPDVVVMDLNMPGIGGLETLRRLRAKDDKARVLIFSIHDNRLIIARAFKAGALGYLTKSSAASQMVEAIHEVYLGKPYLDYNLRKEVSLESLELSEPVDMLTGREFQVFCALAQGQTVNDISETYNISPKTVGIHRSNIMKKLAVRNTAELTRLAISSGAIEI